MKKYFEYEFNEAVKERLLQYYNSREGRSDLDNTEKKVALKLDRISEYISYNKIDYICDVGCSDGSLLRHLNGKFDRALGLDISEEVIEQDKKQNIPNVDFDTYDGMHIPSEETFDKMFLMDVLEHAFEPDILIKSIFNSLRGGGILIMQVPTTGWLSEIVFGKYHYGHLRYYDQKYLKEYLESVGFNVMHIETFNSVPWSQMFINSPRLFAILNGICKRIPNKLYPYYGSVAAIVQKPATVK